MHGHVVHIRFVVLIVCASKKINERDGERRDRRGGEVGDRIAK